MGTQFLQDREHMFLRKHAAIIANLLILILRAFVSENIVIFLMVSLAIQLVIQFTMSKIIKSDSKITNMGINFISNMLFEIYDILAGKNISRSMIEVDLSMAGSFFGAQTAQYCYPYIRNKISFFAVEYRGQDNDNGSNKDVSALAVKQCEASAVLRDNLSDNKDENFHYKNSSAGDFSMGNG